MKKSKKNRVIQTLKEYQKNKNKEYVIKKIQNVRFNSQTGVNQYLVQWEPSEGKQWKPTWQPESFIMRDALFQFYKDKKKKKQFKIKQKISFDKKQEEKLIRDYELKLNQEIQMLQKLGNVSLQKIQQIRQNRQKIYSTKYDKKRAKQSESITIFQNQEEEDQKQKTYDFLIDKIITSKKDSNNHQYYMASTINNKNIFIRQDQLIKFFPEKFMEYVENEQIQCQQNFLRYRKDISRSQNIVAENQFEKIMKQKQLKNECKILIDTNESFKKEKNQKNQLFVDKNIQLNFIKEKSLKKCKKQKVTSSLTKQSLLEENSKNADFLNQLYKSQSDENLFFQD